MVITARAGWPCRARVRRGQAWACPLFLLPRGRRGPRGQGRPAGPSPAGRCGAPLRPGGRPRTLSGRARPAAAQPPPLPGPRSGPAALTRRPFPPATVRNPPGTAHAAREWRRSGCSRRSRRRPRPGPPPWWRTFPRAQLELQGGVPGLDHRVVQSRARPAHGLADAQPLAGLPEAARGVLAALVGVEDHAGHLAAAHGHRHGQRAVGQLRVVVLAERKPEDPARAHVQHRIQIQLALTGDDLGAVAVPVAVRPAAANWRPTRSGARHRPLPCRVVDLRPFLAGPPDPARASGAATVFSLTVHPASRSAAVIRGEPYVPSRCANSRRSRL